MTTKTKITDLEEIFKGWAWDQYLHTSTGIFSRIFSRKLKYKHAIIELRYDHVKFTTLPPKYDQLPTDNNVVKVAMESEYENETSQDQTHSFRTERETISTATFSLTKGYSRSANVGLEVSLPEDMIQTTDGTTDRGQKRKQMATASFGNSLHLDTEEGNTVTKSLKWLVDTTITSKSEDKTIATLEVNETSIAYEFSVNVKMKGRIVVVIRDSRGEGKLVQTVENDVATVLNDIRSNRDWSGRLRDVKFDMASRHVFLPVEGKVEFRYGVSQRVKVTNGDSDSQTKVSRMYPSV